MARKRVSHTLVLPVLFAAVTAACTGETASNREEVQSEEAPETAAAVTTADTGATLNPPPSLSMEEQHETMQEIVRGYARVNQELSKGEGRQAAAAARAVAQAADGIPVFMLHAEGMERADLMRYSRQLKGEMLRVAELAERDSTEAAFSLSRRVTQTCQACHSKYMVPVDSEEAEEHEDEGAGHEDASTGAAERDAP
jgi:hypothetical protein